MVLGDVIDIGESARWFAAILQQTRDKHPGKLTCLNIALGKDAMPVMANPAAIEKILGNLVRNATEAMGCQDCCPSAAGMKVQAYIDNGQAVVCVEDNGGGVPAKMRPHLFEPFQTTKHHGLGIGLSICRELAQQQHGKLWHEDRPGGSAFLLSIPLAS